MHFNFQELNKIRYYNVILILSTDKNNNTIMKIRFPISNKTVYIKEKKFGFFQFIDNFNNNNNNENEEKKVLEK